MAPSSEVPGPRNTQILRLTFPISTSISSIGHTHCTVSWRSEVPGPRNTSRYASYVLPINAISHWRSLFYTGLRHGAEVYQRSTHTADSACYVPNRVNKSLARSLFYTGLRLGFLYSQYYTDIFTHLDILPGVQFSRSQATTCSATTHLANVCKLLPHRSAVFSNPYYRKNQPQGLAHLQATKAPKCPFGPNMLP